MTDAADFRVIKGQTTIYTHVSEGSGKQIHVNFCDRCGTKVFQIFERFPGAVGLFRGTLDDPGWIRPSPETSKHIFLSSARRETLLQAHTPLYWEHVVKTDGTPVAPVMLSTPQSVEDLN